jgi:predicted membrane protein
MPRTHGPIILFGALWIYALTFGFLALAGVHVLALFMDASRFRTVIEVAIMSAATFTGTYLSVPALNATRRFWLIRDEG